MLHKLESYNANKNHPSVFLRIFVPPDFPHTFHLGTHFQTSTRTERSPGGCHCSSWWCSDWGAEGAKPLGEIQGDSWVMQKMDANGWASWSSFNAYLFLIYDIYLQLSTLPVYIVIHRLNIRNICVSYCKHFLLEFGVLYCIPLLKYAKIQRDPQGEILVCYPSAPVTLAGV